MLLNVLIEIDCIEIPRSMPGNLERSLTIFMQDVFQLHNSALVRDFSISVSIKPQLTESPCLASPDYDVIGTAGSD